MREITETNEIGVDDDFFHAGGKSWEALSFMVILAERSCCTPRHEFAS
jgi:hypothetical protein